MIYQYCNINAGNSKREPNLIVVQKHNIVHAQLIILPSKIGKEEKNRKNLDNLFNCNWPEPPVVTMLFWLSVHLSHLCCHLWPIAKNWARHLLCTILEFVQSLCFTGFSLNKRLIFSSIEPKYDAKFFQDLLEQNIFAQKIPQIDLKSESL